METTTDSLAALRDKFEIEEWPEEWHLFCNNCSLSYALKKPRSGAAINVGNILSLLDHSASHARQR